MQVKQRTAAAATTVVLIDFADGTNSDPSTRVPVTPALRDALPFFCSGLQGTCGYVHTHTHTHAHPLAHTPSKKELGRIWPTEFLNLSSP